MPAPTMLRRLFAISLLLLGAAAASAAEPSPAANPDVYGVYAGSSPCGEPIRRVLNDLAAGESCALMEWKLTLHRDAKTQTPTRFSLSADYGAVQQGKPGLAAGAKTLTRTGTWTRARGASPREAVIALAGAFSLVEIDAGILQLLNPDGSLMLGDGGQSYTLNRADRAEPRPDPSWLSQIALPDMSYPIAPLSTGPEVFGVFEARTPCQGIARAQKAEVEASCFKVKWRVTLYQHAATRAPAAYKVEGGLYRTGARRGTWTIARGAHDDPNAVVYALSASGSAPELLLLKGDDNVLFFLDQERRPLVGHSEFSYTLNRRTAP
jgi:hypothetical protein